MHTVCVVIYPHNQFMHSPYFQSHFAFDPDDNDLWRKMSKLSWHCCLWVAFLRHSNLWAFSEIISVVTYWIPCSWPSNVAECDSVGFEIRALGIDLCRFHYQLCSWALFNLSVQILSCHRVVLKNQWRSTFECFVQCLTHSEFSSLLPVTQLSILALSWIIRR